MSIQIINKMKTKDKLNAKKIKEDFLGPNSSFKYQCIASIIFVASQVIEQGFYIQASFISQFIGLFGAPFIIINLPIIAVPIKKSWTYHGTMKRSSIVFSILFGLIFLLRLMNLM